MSSDKCLHCRRKDHNIKTCPDLAYQLANKYQDVKKCGNCRKVGHTVRTCPELVDDDFDNEINISYNTNTTTISLKDVLEQMKDDICDNCGFKGHNKQLCLIELKDIQKYELKYQIKNKYK